MDFEKIHRSIDNGSKLRSVNLQHILSLCILFVLPVILFNSTIIGDKQFMGHDTIQWRAGAESIFEYQAEHDGQVPLWTTNMYGGMPSYTVYLIKSVPHLDNKVFDQLRIIWPAVPYWVLLSGSYFFFILMGFQPLIAALGAIFIGLTTYIPIIIGAGHNIKFISYSYIPWMFCGYWMITHTKNYGWGFILFAVACTLHFRAGHPQVTYYFIYVFIPLFLYEVWRYYKEEKLGSLGKITALLTGGVVLGILGAADQYLRLIEFTPHSIRGGSALAERATTEGLSLEYAFEWSQGLLETFTLIIPDLFGGNSGLYYWGEKPGTGGPHYFGAIAFLLFLIGIIRSSRKIKYIFLGTGFLALTFSWGYHFSLNEFWFNTLPGFDKFRTPEMWLIVTVFSFSVIAVFGFETIINLAKKGKEALKDLYLPMAIAIGLGLIFLFGISFIFPFESERERQEMAQQLAEQQNVSLDNPRIHEQINRVIVANFKSERRQFARNDTLRYMMLAGIGCLMITFYFHSKISKGHLILSLIFFAAIDILMVNSRYISDDALVDKNLELTEVIERQGSSGDKFIRDNKKSSDGYSYRTFPLSDYPFNNAIPSYFYPSLGGYSGAKLSLIQDVIDKGLYTGPLGINMAVLDMLNVKYISAREQLAYPNFQEVHTGDNYYVFENENVLPKTWFAENIIQVPDSRKAFEMIMPDKRFDPHTTAIVESSKDLNVHHDPEAEIEIISYSAESMAFNITRSRPGFMVLSEIYYPHGWTATLNGEEIPIYKTNYLLRGFEIPAGESTLELSFSPASQVLGSRISWAANIVQWFIGIGLVLGWRKKILAGEYNED